MKTIEIEVTGVTPLMHHKMTEEALFQLLGAKTQKNKDKEELTPREIADKHAYKGKDGTYYIPSEYLSGAFIHVSSDYKQKNSPRKSVKGIAGGVFTPVEATISLLDDKNAPITDFEVDIRKATNHQKGAVAVCRPRFDRWKFKTQINIDESLISPETVHEMLNDAGKRSGMGSFRIAKRGSFGAFRVTKFEEISE